MNRQNTSKLREEYTSLFFRTEPADMTTVERGNGSRFFDHDGVEFIDFGAGLACLPFGYSDSSMITVINRQSNKLLHSGSEAINGESVALALALDALKPGYAFFFSSSGAEANEAAFKLARKYSAQRTGKNTIIGMTNSFHGRTMMNISVSGNSAHTDGYEPLLTGIKQVEFNNVAELYDQVDQATCAIVLEVVQGRGGGVEISEEFVTALNCVRDEFGCLIIVDDIQTGIGRLGTFFGFDSYGLEPDIFTLAKGLGGGLPIGLTVARRQIANAMTEGAHGNTFGSNPLIAAVALNVVDRVSQAEFLRNVADSGEMMAAALHEMTAELGCFANVRGRGLMLTLELGGCWKDQAGVISKAALGQGLLIRTAGSNRLRITPALNIPVADRREGLKRLRDAIIQSRPSH